MRCLTTVFHTLSLVMSVNVKAEDNVQAVDQQMIVDLETGDTWAEEQDKYWDFGAGFRVN